MSNSPTYLLLDQFKATLYCSICRGFRDKKQMKVWARRWLGRVAVLGSGMLCMVGIPSLAGTIDGQDLLAVDQPEALLTELENRAAIVWGKGNVWLPTAKMWVQYESDFGERHAVDFENGVAHVQILLKADDDPGREQVLAHLRQGVGNLILSEPRDPVEMIRAQVLKIKTSTDKLLGKKPPLAGKEIRVYLVRERDSLWKIARRFGMKTEELAELNGIHADTTLSPGRPLKVLVFSSHDLTLQSMPSPVAKDPLLKDQLRMVDGRPVSPWLVKDFAREVVGDNLRAAKIRGADGVERLAVDVSFKLVANHLEVRARKFYPLVQAQAELHELDPALIMGIIHTESMFNPRARSRTPAYGLMQVVPHSGGRDAYRKIYGRQQKLTPKYLYNPKNNIELGVAYFTILRNRYLKQILDPTSRTHCAVAAYNAGASNVGGAFIPEKSIQKAAPIINQMEPQEVYAHLIDELPSKESRNYVRKVLKRSDLYQNWQ